MHIVIAGGHGQIARRLTRLLAGRGDEVTGLIRNPDQSADVEADGARAVVCDLESAGVDEIAGLIGGADAVVFAAGAGPGSGEARKWSMDRDGAVKLLAAARQADVERYVIVSSVGAESPPDGDDVFSVYLRAKAEADQAVVASDRAWTIVRPGRLTDDAGAGTVRVDTEPFRTEVSRDDVAAVLAAVLHEPRTAGVVLYAGAGGDPVEPAVSALVSR
jgi:nucleoside-diphosphate-sugar epimerase